jgi:hypothetical protein
MMALEVGVVVESRPGPRRSRLTEEERRLAIRILLIRRCEPMEDGEKTVSHG